MDKILEPGLGRIGLLHGLDPDRMLAKPGNSRCRFVKIVHLSPQPDDNHVICQLTLAGPHLPVRQIEPRHGGLTKGYTLGAEDLGEGDCREV